MFSRLLLIVYFIEAGVLLVIVPWYPIWELNWFVANASWLGNIAESNFVRGAVSGVGLLLVLYGLVDLLSIFMDRRQGPA